MIGLGSNTQLGIGIAVQLHDQFSRQANAINRQLVQMRKNSHTALTAAAQEYRNNAMNIAAGAGAMTYGMYKVVEEVSRFDGKIQQAMVLGEGKIGMNRKQLEQAALSISNALPHTATDIADAMTENIRAGVRSNIDILTKYQAALATAAKENLQGEGGVASITQQIMSSYQFSTNSLKDIQRVTNGLLVAANSSRASVYSIGEAMQYSAFRARTLNIAYEDQLAMIAKIAQSGIDGSSAGTGLNNYLTQLAKSLGPFATPKQLQAWQMLGLNSKEMKNLADSGQIIKVVEAIAQATQGMRPTDVSGILTGIFNLRGDRGLEALFGTDMEGRTVADFAKSIKEGRKADLVMKQSTAMMQSLDNQILLAKNAFFEAKATFTDAIKPVFLVFLQTLTKLAQWGSKILKSDVGGFLAKVAAVLIPLVGIVFAFRAAVLSATLALRAMSFASAGGVAGGWRGLAGGLLGSAGGNAIMGALGGAAVRNKNGMLTVAKGQTVSINGRTFKGGQFLPRNMGGAGASILANGASIAAGGSGLLGRAGASITRAMPWLARMGGVAVRFLPYIGILASVTMLLKGILDSNKRREYLEKNGINNTDINALYLKHLDTRLLGYSQSPDWYKENGTSMAEKAGMGKTELKQSLNIFIDGVPYFHKMLPQTLDQNISTQMNFEIPGI